MRRVNLLDDVRHDVRFALRSFSRSKAFSIAAVLSLALGIGANTAIFSVIDVLMLRPLPVNNPEQLLKLTILAERNITQFGYPQFQKYKESLSLVAEIAAAGEHIDRYNLLSGPAGNVDPGQIWLQTVSGNYFSLLGVKAAVGRTITPNDDRLPGGNPVAVISYNYWQR